MAMTPVHLKQPSLPRSFFGGYRRGAVDELLEEAATGFELVWHERSDLTERVHQLETDLARHVEMEGTLRATLISAERAAQAHRDRALHEADVILEEAHSKARDVTREARADRERLVLATREMAALLRSALSALERAEKVTSEPAAQAESPAAESTPSISALRDPEELGSIAKLAG